MSEIHSNNQKKTSSKWLVFISHSGTDTWVAKQISEKILACGANTFLDEVHVDVGQDFEERILAAIDQANELLVPLTPWSLDRPYVWSEIGAAWGKRMPIIGILYGHTPEQLIAREGIPLFLKKRDLIDINCIDEYFFQLRKRIAGEH